MKRFFFFLAVLGLASCASLTDQGEKVELTSDAAKVKNCKVVGNVIAAPPYSLPSDWKVKLRNAAGALGGNIVFAQTPGMQTTVPGTAYRCP